MKNPWRDYNGPGKPITEDQIKELLAQQGIHPRIDQATGKEYWHRDDFAKAWAKLKELGR